MTTGRGVNCSFLQLIMDSRLEGMRDNRAHPRYNLSHDAFIVARGFVPVACEMANVCLEGMLLSNITSHKLSHHLAENPSSRIEVHLFCRDDNKEKHFTILAGVCRAQAQNLGIQFLQPQPQLVDAIRELQSSKNGHGVLFTTPGKRARLRKWFETLAGQFVGHLLTGVIKRTIDDLLMRIESSTDINEISALREARSVLADIDSYREQFLRSWKSGLEMIMRGEAQILDSSQELKVIDKSHFEGWLEVQMVATSVLNRHRSEMYLLNQYLSQILESEVDDRINPIAPALVGQHLYNTFSGRSLPDIARPLVYRNFEKVLDRAYEDKLASLFGIFKKHGLRAIHMDQLRSNWNKQSSQRVLNHPANDGGMAEQKPADEAQQAVPQSEPQRQPQPSGNILSMLRLQRQLGSGADAFASPDGFDSKGTANAVSIKPEALQAQHEEILKQLSMQNSNLAQALQSEQVVDNLEGRLNDNDWDLANTVDKIFAPVDQHQLPAELKSVVNQLRLPLFTLLLSDQSFFHDPNHAARSLVNNFMALATADRVTSKNLEKLLKQVVEELTSAGKMSPELLEDLSERLNKLVKRQQVAFDRNADRIARTHDGQDRLLSARRAVTRRINTLIAGRQVPDVLIELLDAGWEHAMVLGLLKEGGDSETVVENFAVLEQLFSWLSADADEDLIFEKEIESPGLLEQIERELSTTSQPNRVRNLLQTLENLLYYDGEISYTFIEGYISGDDPGLPVLAPDENTDPRWQERAHQLEVGEWVELTTDAGSQRMRLVWVGEDAFKFVFLTERGMQEAHFDYAELVSKMQVGELSRANEGMVPFVDRSLYEVVEDLYQKMANQAVHDSLTGCMQRRELEKKLNISIQKSKSINQPAALILFDIDRFSVINSHHGTQAGDMVLKNFSKLIDDWLQEYKLEFQLGRIAGNEFALIVGALHNGLAIDIAETVRKRFAESKFKYDGQIFSATLSSGVVVIDNQSPDAGQVLNWGALACDAVKKGGGNAARVYSPDDSDQARQKEVLKWLSLIEGSLAEANLFLRAQLISPVSGEGLPMYEILLGVRDEKGDVVSPAAFIEAGEIYNKSAQIDTWVVTAAFKWMRSNPAKLEKIAAFTINLSGRSLSDNQFFEFLEQEFVQGGFPAEKVCFEVTETSAVANINYTADFMREIKRSGCRFALDDFGTGFSSYAYLQKLPVDFLKVDGSFVQDMHKNLTNYAMVKSISELGHFLQIYTIAECIEEQEGMDAVRKIGVDYAQGYLLGKPLLLNDL